MRVIKFDVAWEQAARQPGCGGLLKRPLKRRLAAAFKLILVGMSMVALATCSTGANALAGTANGMLKAMRLKSSNVPDARKPPREVPLRMTASNNLNATNDRRPVAVAMRLYSLKDPTSFLQSPYGTFIDPACEKQTLNADLANVHKMTLIPSQCYDFAEKVLREATTLGIAALFRNPASQRWKFTFNTEKNEKSDIAIELRAYAMTVASDTLTTLADAIPLTDLSLLSPAVCSS